MRLLGLTGTGFMTRARKCKAKGFLFSYVSGEVIRKKVAKRQWLVVKIYLRLFPILKEIQ